MSTTTTRTLLEMREEIRFRGDIDKDLVGNEKLNRAINVGYKRFYGYLAGQDADHFFTSDNVTVVGGTESYPIPADHWKTKRVEVQDGSEWYKIEPFNWAAMHEPQTTNSSKRATRYRIGGANIYFSPIPSWSGTVRIWYVPAPTNLVEDGDKLDGIVGWEEYVTQNVLMQYAGKTEEDATLFAAQMADIKKDIKELANRDDGEPDRVRDVWAEGGFRGRFGYPRLPRA